MSDWINYPIRNRDIQDGFERHVFGALEHTDAGAIVRVRGTRTKDQEAPVLNTGYGANFSEDFNTEVMLVSLGSDTTQKYAIITIPRDKQRKWRVGTGGVQNPQDPEKAVEFNDKRTHVTQTEFAVGMNGAFEVDANGKAYFRGDVTIVGTLTVNGRVVTPDVVPGTEPVPGFDA